MKFVKTLIIYLPFVFPIMAICLILIISGSVSVFYSGFAVDSSGIIYIGKDSKIEKYYNGKVIGVLNPKTSRGYAFTIQNDDTILLSTASYVYVLDLDGNQLDKWEDIDTKTFDKLQYMREYIAKDGHKYKMKSQFGRTFIYKGDEIVYRMPLPDYLVKISFFLSFLSLFATAPVLIIVYRHKISG